MVRSINAGLSFALELAMLAAFAYWGYTVGDGLVAWALVAAVTVHLGLVVKHQWVDRDGLVRRMQP